MYTANNVWRFLIMLKPNVITRLIVINIATLTELLYNCPLADL